MALDAVGAAAREGRPFDVVLMDVQMPVMSGHEATVELRKVWSASELPIIALTAAALVSERDLAPRRGHERLPDQADRQRQTARGRSRATCAAAPDARAGVDRG
jgi:CheY-like chemotaxis protein